MLSIAQTFVIDILEPYIKELQKQLNKFKNYYTRMSDATFISEMP